MTKRKYIGISVVKFSLTIQLVVFVLIALERLGIAIPVVKEIIVSTYLLLTPGLLTLKTLKVKANFEELLSLSIGVSISAITLLSLLANAMLSPFYEKPISETPLTLIIGGFTLLLLTLCYCKGDQYLIIACDCRQVHLILLSFLPPILMLMSLLSGVNALSFATLVVISITPMTALSKRMDERIYPLLTWTISLSLMILFFFETGPVGWTSWKTGEAVKKVGTWDPFFQSEHNSMLFPILFHPVFSILSGTDLAIGSKAIDSIIFSLVPMVLYAIYRRFLDSTTSFLAACLYAFYPFYHQLLVMNRTGFAFFFASLLLLLVVSEEINLKIRRLLSIIFAFSLITSHYGVAYMFMFLLVPLAVLYAYEKRTGNFKADFVSYSFIILYILMALSWYMYTSRGANFEWGVSLGRHIVTSLKNFFSPEESAAMKDLLTDIVTPSFSLKVTKLLLVVLLGFIAIGALRVTYLYLKRRVDVKFAILMLSFCSPLLGITQSGMPRIFGFSLIFTAILAVQGFSELLVPLVKDNKKSSLLFSLYLIISFAFTYGLVANSLNAVSGNVVDMSLCGTPRNSVLNGDNLDFKRLMYWYWGWQSDSALESARWLFVHHGTGKRVYVDFIVADSHILELTSQLPKEYGGKTLHNLTQPALASIEGVLMGRAREGYVFLASHNINDDFIYVWDKIKGGRYYRTSNYQDIFAYMNKVYDSGGGVTYEGEADTARANSLARVSDANQR